MNGCNENCNQGRNCTCTCHQRSDRWFRWFLLFAALYFLGHMVYALADTTVFTPDGKVVTCRPLPNGTLVCI